VYGLVPPPRFDGATKCTHGISKVETKVSFLNGVAWVATYGLFTPMDIHITCARERGVSPFDQPLRREVNAVREVHRSGPRFGVTHLSPGILSALQKRNIEVGAVISQFGWHFENQISAFEGGPSAVTQWVLLVGGLERSLIIPSLSWVIGIRTQGSFEFGVGPNVTLSPDSSAKLSTALVLGIGQTFPMGVLNVPLNLAVVPSRSGVRVSILTGFNVHR
jgi:hypothetical protein